MTIRFKYLQTGIYLKKLSQNLNQILRFILFDQYFFCQNYVIQTVDYGNGEAINTYKLHCGYKSISFQIKHDFLIRYNIYP